MLYLLPLLLVLLPLYVWRFELVGLPTNFLMVATGLIWIVFFIETTMRRQWGKFFDSVRNLPTYFLIPLIGLGAASLVALFTGGLTQENLGQWLVLYLQPISLFFIVHFTVQRYPTVRPLLVYSAYAVIAAAGLVALVQYFTLATLPAQWWGNSVEPKRAIAFFVHANGFGLFVTPLLAWLLPDVMQRLSDRKQWYLVAAWLLGAVGIFLSLSRGAWLGLAAAVGIYVLISANRKYLIGAVVAALALLIVIVSVPNLRYRLLLPFYGEKSSVARVSLWHTGARMVNDSPIFGKGINGFSNNWDQYNRDVNLEHYNSPHNTFLNFWVDAGILGLLSFVFLELYGVVQGFKNKRHIYKLGLALFLIALFIHGQIDTPYLKNDLAALFWIIWALSI